jgi:quercetin dioxygenase-like cupin family protein
MEFLDLASFVQLSNPGVQSTQLLSPQNSRSARVTITSVTVQPGAEQPRHTHETSEQIWLAVEGSGTLLLDGENIQEFHQGQVVRFEDGDVHGLKNNSAQPFKYISITSPPINFSYAYTEEAQLNV